MTACPDKELMLQAFSDGELDALGVAAFEGHLASCAACRDELARIQTIRTALQDRRTRLVASPMLRTRIEALAGAVEVAPTAARPSRFAWEAFAGGGGIGALAASLALFFALPQIAAPGLPDELVASHVRSLQASHLVDIATSNRHVVKPWFNGRIDFAPPVPDLARQGFPLVGGRLDVVDGRTVAALVYKRQLHSINLFVRPTSAAALTSSAVIRRNSYSLIRWRENGLEFWAVSDIEPNDLALFSQEFRSAASAPGRSEGSGSR